jgi:hypothetical protein
MSFKVRDQTEWRNKLLTLLGETDLTWEKILAKTVARLEVSEPYRQRLCRAVGLPPNEAWTDLWPKLEAALKRAPSGDLVDFKFAIHRDLEEALGQRGTDLTDLLDKVEGIRHSIGETSKQHKAKLAKALGVELGERTFDTLVGMVEQLARQKALEARREPEPGFVGQVVELILQPFFERLSNAFRYGLGDF